MASELVLLDDDAVLDVLRSLPPAPQSVDLDEAQRSLRWLDPSASMFTFQVIHPGGRTPIIHGPLAGDLAKRLERENLAGAGIFMMINRGDGRGRKTENVILVRFVFLDLDGGPLPAPELHQAHGMIESSPDRWHLYWRVESIELKYFSAVQRALAATFGGDPKVSDLPRVMRVPGFLHRKGEPFMTRAWWLDHDAPPLTLAELCARWPLVAEAVHEVDHPPPAPESPPMRLARRGRGSYAWKALEGEYDALKATQAGAGRHDALLKAARRLGTLVPALLDEADVRDALLLACDANRYLAKVGQPEVERVIRDGLRHGMAHPRELEVA